MEYVELHLINGDIEYAQIEGKFEEIKEKSARANKGLAHFITIRTIGGFLVPLASVVKYKIHKTKPWIEKEVEGKLNKDDEHVKFEPTVKIKYKFEPDKINRLFE